MASPSTRRAAALLTALVALVGLTGCATIEQIVSEGADAPVTGPVVDAPTADPVEVEDDYFTIIGPAEQTYEITAPGEIEYCALDELGRAVCAFGSLTVETREAAQQRGRQDIEVDPTGFTDNAETTIPALDGVEGSQEYNGWFWNRSHLVADSLGGEPIAENAVTGTRTQNVGSTQVDGQYAGGQAYTEKIARDYLDSTAAETCPLYYATTADYVGDELVPRTTTTDIRSCDGEIDMRVEISNTAAGHEIDYATGRWSATD